MHNSIDFKSKEYVVRALFKEVKKSPFIAHMKYQDYLEFLSNQIQNVSGVKIQNLKESAIFDGLKKIGMIKEKKNFL